MDTNEIRWAQMPPDAPTVRAGLAESSYAAEQYRSLAVQLDDRLGPTTPDRGRVLAVSGCEPDCGKTLTSLNLALTLARKGLRRVLLLETDLWRPHLSTYLRVEPSVPGLCQMIEERIPYNETVVSVWGARGLDVIFAGATERVENLMAKRRMADLLEELRSRYELVIFDSPPALLSSGRSLARLADAVLLVVRAEHTTKKEIEDVLSSLAPEKVAGLTLNRVRRARLHSSSYRAYSYYDHPHASPLRAIEPRDGPSAPRRLRGNR